MSSSLAIGLNLSFPLFFTSSLLSEINTTPGNENALTPEIQELWASSIIELARIGVLARKVPEDQRIELNPIGSKSVFRRAASFTSEGKERNRYGKNYGHDAGFPRKTDSALWSAAVVWKRPAAAL